MGVKEVIVAPGMQGSCTFHLLTLLPLVRLSPFPFSQEMERGDGTPIRAVLWTRHGIHDGFITSVLIPLARLSDGCI